MLETLCSNFSESTKIAFNLDCDRALSGAYINPDAAKYITRIAQEILSNIQKHSFATKFTLSIREKEEEHEGKILTLIFIDDGAGCDLDSLSGKNMKSHFGMRNMRLFAKAAGAKIEFLSASDEGMQVRLSIKIAGQGI